MEQERLRHADDADVLYDRATALLGQGLIEQAAAHYRQALALQPDFPEAHTNLANILGHLGQSDAALVHYRQALALGLDHPLVHYNLANLLKTLERHEDALSHYRHAVALYPDFAEAYNNQGNALRSLGRLDEAADAYLAALDIRPDYDDAHGNLAAVLYLLHQEGGVGPAQDRADLWLARHPDNAVARHIGAALMRAELPADAVPQRASADYVRQTFDRFAAEFEEKLLDLGYRAPELLAEAVMAGLPEARGLAVLDAGCGTGLCAPLLRPLARHLAGVDLSPAMLERAAARGLYDRLEVADLGVFLAGERQSYDLIVAADVLCYFGVLDVIMPALAAALRPGGLLAFTLELATGDCDCVINPHGRYSHGEAYVRRMADAAGLSVRRLSVEPLRHEGGRPVSGLLGVAVKAPAAS